MTTKDLSRKQVIVPMNANNSKNFIKNSSSLVSNINRALKNIKSDVMADFICSNNKGMVITTNKVASSLNLQTIGRYFKNMNNIKANHVESLRLLQPKSFLKIIGILYLRKDTLASITADVIEKIVKDNHIFNNVVLVLRSSIIKVLPKLDMSIVWFDIWDAQSSIKIKGLINKCFNIGSYITTIQGANMNLGILQCKNCWKWGHVTGTCRIQGARCVKYNSSYKSKHHCYFA